jgi:hypothetical protein
VVEVLAKIGRHALPIGIRNLAGDAREGCRQIDAVAVVREPSRILAFSQKFKTFPHNFISRAVASAAYSFSDQSLNFRALGNSHNRTLWMA